jgi:putative redox protein
VAPKPPVVVDLSWDGDLRFTTTFATGVTAVIDSAGKAGPSPVEALAAALGGCMGMDLAHILSRGRHSFHSLTAHLEAERAPEDPHRVVRVSLRFALAGAVPPDAVERAIALSRDKYCSVWQSLRQDIDLQVTFAIAS